MTHAKTTGSVISFTCLVFRSRGSNPALPTSYASVPKIWPELERLQLSWVRSWPRHARVGFFALLVFFQIFFALLKMKECPLY